MKVSERIGLLSVGLCALTLVLCGALFLHAVYSRSLSAARENAKARLSFLATSYAIAADREGEAPLSERAENSRLQYLFRRFERGGASWQLVRGGQTLYNDAGYALDRLLETESERTVRLDGRHLFLAKAQLPNDSTLYVLYDCSDVFLQQRALTRLFLWIGGSAFLLTAVLTFWLTGRLLSPLKTLERAAKRIAAGDYSTPIAVRRTDEIGSLAQSFERMRQSVRAHIERVSEVAEERKLLLGALTHELKTPLTSIIGYSEALEKLRLSPKERRECVAFLHRESRRLEALTQKLMRLITLSGGEPIDAVSVTGDALERVVRPLLEPIAQRNGAMLRFVWEDFSATGDEDLLCSALANLFDNAVSAGAKHIAIEGRGSVLTVRDDGCGIPPEALACVTEPFFCANKTQGREAGHAGLGLALVGEIAKAFGGTLEVESALGAGTAVTLRLCAPIVTESLPSEEDFLTR